MDLSKYTKEQIRTDENLLKEFISQFENKFNYKPKCTGCSYNSDFKKLFGSRNNNINFKHTEMENYEINRKHNGTIFTYLNKLGKAVRSYGRNMTDDFAENYIKTGVGEDRKAIFNKLPTEKKVEPLEVVPEVKKTRKGRRKNNK